MSALAWVLTVGAIWRLTFLVTADEITRPARNGLAEWIDTDWFSYWISCSWCVPPWIAPPVVASGLAWSSGWGWQLAAGSLAASAVTGFLSSFASPDG